MKFKKLLNIIIFICFIVLIILFFQYKPLEKTNILTENISDENSIDIESCNIYHIFANYNLIDHPHFSSYIELSSSQPYGKIFYANNSPYSAKLIVDDKEPVIVEPYSSNSVVWKKGTFKNSYEFTVTATQGNLDGYFSLAKAEKEEDFQN